MMQDRSPWRIVGLALAGISIAVGTVGVLFGLMLLSGSGGRDQHGYASIFGVFLMIVSIPFLLIGLMSVLPKQAALWLSRAVAVLGVLLIIGLVISLKLP